MERNRDTNDRQAAVACPMTPTSTSTVGAQTGANSAVYNLRNNN